MNEIIFDTEGITDCPMKKGKATVSDCIECIYCKDNNTDKPICIYKDIFTEEKE